MGKGRVAPDPKETFTTQVLLEIITLNAICINYFNFSVIINKAITNSDSSRVVNDNNKVIVTL